MEQIMRSPLGHRVKHPPKYQAAGRVSFSCWFEYAAYTGVQIFVEHWGDNKHFNPILPYFQRWGGWTSTTIFSGGQIKRRPKKRSSAKMEHFFPLIQVESCAQMQTRVKLLEGMQMKTILKLLGGIQSNY